MRPIRGVVIAVLAGLLVPSVAVACLWDYDTIKMERSRFPATLELITGKFLRHSPEFYQWRIENRLKRLESDPTNIALLDDLAVAYDKIGQHDKAIETALKIEKLHPGRYETASNLATFYFHAGKPEEGIPLLDRALKINPDAHFGREKYQKWLTEYVIEQKKGGPLKLPLAEIEVYPNAPTDTIGAHDHKTKNTFADFLKVKLGKSDGSFLDVEEVEAAIKAVKGMMKFAKYDSPVLLEALGVLLAHREFDTPNDAKQLAARAFLKASYEVPEGPSRIAYRRMATRAISMQVLPSGQRDEAANLVGVEADFQRELEEGRAWYADLREREVSWIRDGKDPEAEFDKLYDAEPEVSGMDAKDPLLHRVGGLQGLLIGGTVLLGIVLIASLIGIGLVIRAVLRKRTAV